MACKTEGRVHQALCSQEMNAVRLEPLSPENFEQVARWLSNGSVNQWLSGDWRGKETTATIIAIAHRNRRNRFFLVYRQDVPCGFVALSDIEATDNTAMIWYFLGDNSLSGKGIMSEAVRQLVKHAFTSLGLRSVYAWAVETNAASVKLLNKCGFRVVGRIRKSACFGSQQLDRIYFDIVAHDC